MTLNFNPVMSIRDQDIALSISYLPTLSWARSRPPLSPLGLNSELSKVTLDHKLLLLLTSQPETVTIHKHVLAKRPSSSVSDQQPAPTACALWLTMFSHMPTARSPKGAHLGVVLVPEHAQQVNDDVLVLQVLQAAADVHLVHQLPLRAQGVRVWGLGGLNF